MKQPFFLPRRGGGRKKNIPDRKSDRKFSVRQNKILTKPLGKAIMKFVTIEVDAMTLDLRRIFATEGAATPVSYELDLSSVDHAGGFPLKKPVKVSGSVSNKADTVLLSLEISYEYTACCDRCGEEATHSYTVSLERALAAAIEGEESDTILTVPDLKLDVDELVFTEVFVSLPTKFLCREDCRGLCPHCGKNLNAGDCGCASREIDPRLAKLADLLNQ